MKISEVKSLLSRLGIELIRKENLILVAKNGDVEVELTLAESFMLLTELNELDCQNILKAIEHCS